MIEDNFFLVVCRQEGTHQHCVFTSSLCYFLADDLFLCFIIIRFSPEIKKTYGQIKCNNSVIGYREHCVKKSLKYFQQNNSCHRVYIISSIVRGKGVMETIKKVIRFNCKIEKNEVLLVLCLSRFYPRCKLCVV